MSNELAQTPKKSTNSLLKSGLIVSAMTFISRILGLVRDVVVARLMGDGAAADVFFFVNKIPNFLRRLFAEGAFAQAFIPVLTEQQSKNDDAAFKLFIAKISGTLGGIVFVTTVLGVLASPVIAALFGTGWFIDYLNGNPDGAKFQLAALMLKITFPYLFFVALTALSGAILNALNQFAVASFTPVLLNISIISCAIMLSPRLEEPAFGLAWGVFIGGICQLLFQIPFLYKQGLLIKPSWGWSHPQVQKVRKLMIPALFGVSVAQINLLLDTFIASFLVTGSISWLYYSDRLLEFPLGLFGIAIATVILPTLSKNHIKNNANAFKTNMDWAVRMVCFIGLPAAAGLAVLSEPILKVIFERGAFTAQTATMASFSLTAYGLGLVSFMLVKVLAPGYFSRQDTQSPVKYGIICMVANMVFNLILVVPFEYIGLALATSLSGTLNAVLLYYGLRRDKVFALSNNAKKFILKSLCATLVMVLSLKGYTTMVSFADTVFANRALLLAFAIIFGALSYLLVCFILGIRLKHLKPAS
jgi:putative peptidoglycan lipid II flippase